MNFDKTISGSSTVEVYSSNGTKVLDHTIENVANGTAKIDVSTLPNGLYLVKVQNESLQGTARIVIGR